ncbi:MAG: winged helix-turn-helix domain-containing protein, partial [Bacteroidota bacterium]
ELDLTHSEFKLLHLFINKPGQVFTRNQIIEKLSGMDYIVTERSIDVQIVGLRKKMGKHKDQLETVRGVGYRLRE